MRRMSMALVLAVAAGGLGVSAVTAQAATATASVDGPPYAYADCLKATAAKGETPSQGKSHCDQLVRKGWVSPPKG
ncbi:hypothetical protein [Streptomyces silvensis]|nr:hypothetical protein [Streptomyces silvensis]